MISVKNLVQWLLIAAAGSASFYAAMQWRVSSMAEAPDLALAATRDTPRTASVPKAINGQPSAETSGHDTPLTLPDRSRAVPESHGDAFAKLSWLPPPPIVHVAPPKPPPPVVPVAPPLPFTFVGLMEQGTAKPQAFLSKGDALLVVAAGDVIDNNTYRVDSLSAQQIVITYLPLNTPQTLSILGMSK